MEAAWTHCMSKHLLIWFMLTILSSPMTFHCYVPRHQSALNFGVGSENEKNSTAAFPMKPVSKKTQRCYKQCNGRASR